MATRTQYRAILPVLNGHFTTYPGHPWWLSDDVQLGTISDHEIRLISEGSPKGFEHRIDSGQKCFYLAGLPGGRYDDVKRDQKTIVQAVALCTQVAFNLVGAAASAAVIPYGVVVSETATPRVKGIHEFEIWGDPLTIRRQKYRLKPDIEKREIRHLFEVTRQVVVASPSFRVTVNRFCSALLKSNPEDKLIDLTISLESLIPGGGEFGFRFPYYLSLLVDRDTGRRREAYDLLRALYNARSGLVHGYTDRGKERDLTRSLEGWPHLVRYAKQCIVYRLHFSYALPNAKWDDHLLDLAYAGEPIL